jgi:tape measure domain-containing protein
MSGSNEVKVRLAIDGADRARAELGSVENQLDRFTGAVSRVGRYGAGFLLLNQGIAPTIGASIRAADAVTTLHNSLKLATGSAEKAGQAYESLFAIAQRSRVSFTELGGTFASISRAGQELGVSQQRLLTVTEAIGNAMTISGGSAQSMQAALVQLGQGLSSGTLRGEELNSVMEQAPRLAKALADGLGVPIGKLREMGAAGQITAEQVISALESQSKTLATEVTGATLTVNIISLEQQLYQVQNAGNTEALRAAELAGLTDVEIALQQQIWAYLDAQSAAEAASAAAERELADEQLRQAEAARQAAEAIASERLGLQKQLWQALGDEASLRAQVLAELDPSNRALQQQIWALEDQKTAAEEAARAQEEAANAAEQLASAWKNIADGLLSEAQRIRGVMAESAGDSLATLQAQFALTTAQARAGDQTAAGNLAEIARSLETASLARSSTLADALLACA